MKLHLKLIILFFCLSFMSCANNKNAHSDTQKQKPPCDCVKSYSELIEKLESNYIGLALIKNTQKYEEYETLKTEFASQANLQTASSCTQFLMKYLSFYEDGHLFALETPKLTQESLEKQQLFLSKNKKTITEIKEMLLDTSDVLVGKWSDGESVFAIVKNDSFFDGYLIKSNRENTETGSLKIRLTKTQKGYEGSYHSYDFNTKYVRTELYMQNNGLIHIMGGSRRWIRSMDEKIISTQVAPHISKINDIHTLLTIPSFSVDPKEFTELLKRNDSTIKNSRHLIIDIRGNTGGNSIYFPLLEYFATQTLTSEPGYVLASPTNRAYFKQFIGFFGSKIYSPLLKRMTKDGVIVDGPSYPDKKFNKTKNKIEKVSILADSTCMSASESFILAAKGASTKVMTFGTATSGVIDYTSVNMILLKHSGNQNIFFGYPTGTLHQDVLENGYNKTGILPDIHQSDTTQDLIQFVINYYEDIHL